MVNNKIELKIPKSSEERVTKQFLYDTLRQFNSGDLSISQAQDLIVGYFSPEQVRHRRLEDHDVLVARGEAEPL